MDIMLLSFFIRQVGRKKEERKNVNTHLSPFVFALQMKIQVFSFETWCRI